MSKNRDGHFRDRSCASRPGTWCRFLVAFCALGLGACETRKVTIAAGAFTAVDRIEQELRRGVSTKADVERLLGKPLGAGAAHMAGVRYAIPLAPGEPHDRIWVYQDIEASVVDAKGGVTNVHLRMQLLHVYFRGDRFDGFMWFSNAGTGSSTREPNK